MIDLCCGLWDTTCAARAGRLAGVTIVTVIMIAALVGMARVFARLLLVFPLSSIVCVAC